MLTCQWRCGEGQALGPSLDDNVQADASCAIFSLQASRTSFGARFSRKRLPLRVFGFTRWVCCGASCASALAAAAVLLPPRCDSSRLLLRLLRPLFCAISLPLTLGQCDWGTPPTPACAAKAEGAATRSVPPGYNPVTLRRHEID